MFIVENYIQKTKVVWMIVKEYVSTINTFFLNKYTFFIPSCSKEIFCNVKTKIRLNFFKNKIAGSSYENTRSFYVTSLFTFCLGFSSCFSNVIDIFKQLFLSCCCFCIYLCD